MANFVGTREAARFLAISPKTLEKLHSAGGGPVYHKVRRRVIYRLNDLERWAEAGRRQSTAQARPPVGAIHGRPRRSAHRCDGSRR